MGKHRDKVLGKGFKASKFNPLVTLSLSRISVLKLQRHIRSTRAQNDVLQLLRFGHHQRALLRVEHVIKERNMMDAYDIIEGYCDLLRERADLNKTKSFGFYYLVSELLRLVEYGAEETVLACRECPEELKEATSTIIYAASGCGDFPELQEIRSIFTSHFGREFAARAVELRNNCGVNVTLSTREPSLETRMKVLQLIATENGMSLHFEGDSSSSMLEKKPTSTETDHEVPALRVDMYCRPEICQDSLRTRKFKDVADAAAARAAMELSLSAPQDPDYQTGADSQETKPIEELVDSISDEQVLSIVNLMEDGVITEEVNRRGSLSISDVADVETTESVSQEVEIMVENSGFDIESKDKVEILSKGSPMEKVNEKSEEIKLQSKDSKELNSILPADEKLKPYLVPFSEEYPPEASGRSQSTTICCDKCRSDDDKYETENWF